MNLQQLQREKLKMILNLNQLMQDEDQIEEDEDVIIDKDFKWKIIIYDDFCQDILSCLMKVGHLREQNITLHLNINSKRERIDGVECLYLIKADKHKKIIEDIRNKLYEKIYINLMGELKEEELNLMASEIGKLNEQDRIQQVFVHNLEFQTLNDRLFNLNIENVYRKLKRKEQEIEELAAGLLSVVELLKQEDVSIFSLGQNSCRVSEEMQKIRERRPRDNMDKDEERQKMGLIILDRDLDNSVVMLHPWHYGALIHDVITIKNNSVKLPQHDHFDLDYQADTFWNSKINMPFPFVAEDLENDFNNWKNTYQNMAHKKTFQNANDMSQNLSSAIDQLPEMSEKKKRIDGHTNLISVLLDNIKSRKLDVFFELGQQIMNQEQLQSEDIKEIEQLFMDKETNEHDLLRLVLICYFSYKERQNKVILEIEKSLKEKKKEYGEVIDQVKRMCDIKEIKIIDAGEKKGGNYINYIAGKMKDKGKDLMQNIKKTFIQDKRYKVSRIVENIYENNWGLIDENFEYCNINFPKRIKGVRNIFESYDILMVCVLDGACYNEFENLQGLSALINKPIYYGGAQIYNAQQLIAEFN